MSRSIFRSLVTKGPLRALRNRNFAIVEAAGWFSAAGVWFYRIAIQVLTWELTHSGVWLGIIALAEAIPVILLSPIAGTLTDRHDRLVMARVVQFAIMVITAGLAGVTLAGWIDIYILLGFALVHGAAGAFWMPVRLAMVPNLVRREDLAVAIALHSTLFNLARFLGPALAVPILALWGAGAAFAINTASYMIYLVALFMVELVNPDSRAKHGRNMMEHFKEGLAYAVGHPALKYLFLMILFSSVFLRAYMELLPGISETLFSHDAKEGVAILVSAAGLGAIGGSIAIGSMVRLERLLRIYFFCLAGSAIFLTLFAVSTSFWLAAACSVFLSATTVAINIAGQIIVQSTVAGELRGRVMSLWGLITRAGPALGALLLGWLSGFMGFQWPILAAAAITGVAAFYVIGKRQEIETGLGPPPAGT